MEKKSFALIRLEDLFGIDGAKEVLECSYRLEHYRQELQARLAYDAYQELVQEAATWRYPAPSNASFVVFVRQEADLLHRELSKLMTQDEFDRSLKLMQHKRYLDQEMRKLRERDDKKPPR